MLLLPFSLNTVLLPLLFARTEKAKIGSRGGHFFFVQRVLSIGGDKEPKKQKTLFCTVSCSLFVLCLFCVGFRG